MNSKGQQYSIWTEAEDWTPGRWNPADDNSEVIVTFEKGERWVATFFSYQNILSLRDKNRQTGECLSGKYFCATDRILVDEVTRERIEEGVFEMLDQKEFDTYFAVCERESNGAV